MGSGQLGRMFTQVAVKQGYNVICYSPDKKSPAAKSGAVDFTGNYTNLKKLESFLKQVDAITFEFENIPDKALDFIKKFSHKNKIPVSPDPEAIKISQKRNLEKSFFRSIGLQTADFLFFPGKKDLKKRMDEIVYPCILKTNSLGYDGKGQFKLLSRNDLKKIINKLPDVEFITEQIVGFSCEISVIAAGFQNKSQVIFPPSENIHKNGILDITIHPARISDTTSEKAVAAAKLLLEKLNYVGVLGLELFVVNNEIMVNEFAPRPHNSGHYSQDAANFSQFELQLKTLTNHPIQSEIKTIPAIMKNILGDDMKRELNLSSSRLLNSNFHLHLYGKDKVKKGRKMGHWNYTGWDGKSDPLLVFR